MTSWPQMVVSATASPTGRPWNPQLFSIPNWVAAATAVPPGATSERADEAVVTRSACRKPSPGQRRHPGAALLSTLTIVAATRTTIHSQDSVVTTSQTSRVVGDLRQQVREDDADDDDRGDAAHDPSPPCPLLLPDVLELLLDELVLEVLFVSRHGSETLHRPGGRRRGRDSRLDRRLLARLAAAQVVEEQRDRDPRVGHDDHVDERADPVHEGERGLRQEEEEDADDRAGEKGGDVDEACDRQHAQEPSPDERGVRRSACPAERCSSTQACVSTALRTR